MVERPDGKLLHFKETGGVWNGDSDTDIKLMRTGTNWVLTDHNDTAEIYVELSSGKAILQQIVARNGYTCSTYPQKRQLKS